MVRRQMSSRLGYYAMLGGLCLCECSKVEVAATFSVNVLCLSSRTLDASTMSHLDSKRYDLNNLFKPRT